MVVRGVLGCRLGERGLKESLRLLARPSPATPPRVNDVISSVLQSVLSMTDLFSYLLPYPASVLRSDSDPNLNFLVSLLVLLIEKAMFG